MYVCIKKWNFIYFKSMAWIIPQKQGVTVWKQGLEQLGNGLWPAVFLFVQLFGDNSVHSLGVVANRSFVFIVMSGELTKFHMFPKGETLHCLKVIN